ncbi:MAG: CHAT domain-containing protein [Saprospiraceae bacterium]|nr:CHAT domain-containing protein [Saprospiraceae bacterium]
MKTSHYWPFLLVVGIALCSQVPDNSAPTSSIAGSQEGRTLWEKSEQFLGKEEYDSAFVYAQKAAERTEKEKNWSLWGKVQITILAVYYGQGQVNESASRFAELEKKARSIIPQDSVFWGEYYNYAAATYTEAGNYERALDYGLKEIAFYEKRGEKTTFAVACNNIGYTYRSRGDYDRALEYTQTALQIFKSDPDADPSDLAWTYGNLSKIWYRKKDFQRSFAYASKALDILERHFPGDKPDDFVSTYNDLSNSLTELQQYDKALDYLKKALAVFQTNHLADGIEITWHNLGHIYRMMGRYKESKRYMNMALERYGQGHPNLGKAYRHMGYIAFHEADLAGALQWLQKALLALTDSFPYQDVLANPAVQRVNAYQDFLLTLRDKGEVLKAMADKESDQKYLEASLATYDIAAGLLDSMRSEYQEGSQQFWNQEARPIMENAIEVALSLYSGTGENRYLEEAFRYTEKSKALLLAEALRESAAKQQAGIPDELLQEEKKLKINIAFYKKQVFREQQRSRPDTSKILLWQKEILQNRRSYESLLSKLEYAYPEYFNIKYQNSTITMAAVQGALPAGTGLLEYFKGDSNIFAFYIDQNHLRGVRLKPDSNFTGHLERLLDCLRDRNTVSEQGRSAAAVAAFEADASALYRMLVAQACEAPPGQLIVIPDGRLSYLPFELLLTDSTAADDNSYAGLPYLLRRSSLRYEYSAVLAMQGDNAPQGGGAFAGYAPVYGGVWSATDLRGDRTNCQEATPEDFASLRNNQQEVQQIAGIMGGRSYLGAAATENHFKQHARDARILHLAMHGFLNDCDPLYSGLVFSNIADTISQNGNDEEEDGFLHAYEIYNMRLRAELAVLSACNTGRGQLAKGEGVISLARAFKYAGCANILMSLWQADDQATAQIMQDFYRYLKQGMGKDAAIRQAKLDYLDSNRRNHPFYWGAFVLIGDDLPLNSSRFPWFYFSIGAGLVVLIVIVAIWRRRAKSL